MVCQLLCIPSALSVIHILLFIFLLFACIIASPLMAESLSKRARSAWDAPAEQLDPSDGLSVAVHSKCIINDSHSPVSLLCVK